jgi:hypothetical protein
MPTRCQRLGKECVPSAVVRKRGGKRASSSSTRRVRLEDRLDDLVTLLQAQHSSQASSCGTTHHNGQILPTTADPRVLSNNNSSHNGQPLNPDDLLGCSNPSSQVPTPATTASESTGGREPPSMSIFLPDRTEPFFYIFKEYHLRFCPLIYFPAVLTAEQLQNDRPFLWLAIRAVCTKSPVHQHELGTQVREVLAKRVIVDGERNMDLLLGLVTYLCWYIRPGLNALTLSQVTEQC